MNIQAIYTSLVQGVEKFHFGGTCVPCQLLLTSDNAVPVAVSPSDHILIAASQYGKGRIVVMGHEAYMEDMDFEPFLKNAISWLTPQSDAWVGVCKRPHLFENLSKAGFSVKSLHHFDSSVGVYCCDAYNDHQAAKLVKFVKEGGGLLIGGQAWHWGCTHKEDVIASFPGNKIIRAFGVSFTTMYGEKGTFKVPQKIPHLPIFVQHSKDLKQDLSILLDGLTDFDLSNTSVPSSLLPHGLLAFPVAQDDAGQVFMAAAHYGGGKVVVLPHEEYLTTPAIQSAILNAMHWLDAGKKGHVFVHPDIKNFHDVLSANNFKSKVSVLGAEASVYCCTSYHDTFAEEIHCFVAEGGGLLMAGHAWWWAYCNPGQDVFTGYPGNRILNRFGVGILQFTVNQKCYKAPSVDEALQYPHIRRELSELINHVKKRKPLEEFGLPWAPLARSYDSFLRMAAIQSPMYSTVMQELTWVITHTKVLEVGPKHPVNTDIGKVLLKCAGTIHELSPGQLTPCAPNLCISTAAVSITVDGTNKGAEAWRSMGLYAPPGKQVTLCVPSAMTGKGLQVQIGCHKDDLSGLKELKRAPVVTRRFAINTEIVEVSSLWGGLLYIIVPEKSDLGKVDVVVQNAVLAPYFKLGVTKVSDWKSTVRSHPAPWAELEADSIILTVPSKDIHHLDDPTPLLTLWTQVMEAIARLAADTYPFNRPERIVTDIQISAGWMHSGYPVMAHLGSVKEIAHIEHIQSHGMWGPIHELGHNQQGGLWDIPGHTGEATCNLWSVYVHEEVLHIPRHKAHGALKPNERKAAIEAYIREGRNLDKWTVFTCLETYLQLQEGFGWKPFIQLFAEYKTMPQTQMKNEERMNLWVEKFSQKVKMNLVPFFKAWGWPVEEELVRKLSTLPEWEKNPMKKYV